MALIPGSRLGVYDITAKLGEGGMGEVYRATDSNLKRQVAIKVLPAAVAADADRLARFQREAEVLAALNHPNIAAIYGLEKTADFTALVMELVEGEDLSQRIARGAIPLDEALPIAKQIAEALEAAHEQGIIHRDLKPANIKVRTDGTVKVLDFGLARTVEASGAGRAGGENSPTITTPAMTQAGMILGTAAYMAPEQARGKAVDRRADIWAFGAVLFEMLTGTRAFGDEDVSLTLANVLKQDVQWAALPADLPAPLVRLLRRCLERDPRKRLRDIGEARLALEDSASFEPALAPSPFPATPPAPTWRRALPWLTTALFGAGLAAALLVRPSVISAPQAESRRLLAGIGADAYIVTNDQVQGSAVAVSPDGKTLALIAASKAPGRPHQIFVRKLDQLQAAPLAGTEGAFAPFFSPDSQWIAFFVNEDSGGVLKKIPVTGGAAVRLCAAQTGRGGSWGEDGTIVFSQLTRPESTLMRVPATGGTATPFGTFGVGATSQRWPQILPGGTHVLYTEHSSVNRFEHANLIIAPLPALSADASASNEPRIIVQGGSYGRYVGVGSNGFLTYIRETTLMAMPFDLARLASTGTAAPVVEDLVPAGAGGSATVTVSPNGTLMYLPSVSDDPGTAIDWLSRDGTTAVLRSAKSHWMSLRLSPNGQNLALTEADKRRRVIVYDLARDVAKQLIHEGEAASVAWSPNGKQLAFASDTGAGVSNLWVANADGSGSPVRLTTSPNDQQPSSWDPTGRFLAYTEIRPNTTRDVMILPMLGDGSQGLKGGTPIVFKAGAANDGEPEFSPDGRWIAYVANESGASEVYVSPFPGPGPTTVISNGGGRVPRWSAAAHELLFWSGGRLMSASYATGVDTFVPGKPQPWAAQAGAVYPHFDVHRDGKRVAVILVDAEARRAALYSRDKIVFWSGFVDYLRETVVARH